MERVGQPTSQQAKSDPAAEPTVTFSTSAGFLKRLVDAVNSLTFSSYQSGILYLVGKNADGGINIHQTNVRKPMGIATKESGGFVLATAGGIEQFENSLKAGQRANGIFDGCFVPRTVHFTGSLDAHDVGVLSDGTPLFVNTRHNCLSVPDPVHSFRVHWKPPFISRVVDEDRCHLNGLAMRNHEPAFVTAVSRSDTVDGWRDRRRDGGVLLEVPSGEIVCEGLSMPHSPRWHNDRLWVLNSGEGQLGYIEDNKFVSVAFCPGFLRGLAFIGGFAYVGLSKPRYERFEGLGLDAILRDKDTEPWCGIQVIDCNTGACVDWLRIDGAVSEIYDVAGLKGVQTPMAVGTQSEELLNFITFAE